MGCTANTDVSRWWEELTDRSSPHAWRYTVEMLVINTTVLGRCVVAKQCTPLHAVTARVTVGP